MTDWVKTKEGANPAKSGDHANAIEVRYVSLVARFRDRLVNQVNEITALTAGPMPDLGEISEKAHMLAGGSGSWACVCRLPPP